jgi:hypothetical protein
VTAIAAPAARLVLSDAALIALAPEGVLRRGIAYFQSGRVLSVLSHGDRLEARVEGSVRGKPYRVELAPAPPDGVDSRCTCPYEGPTCKHAIAALAAFRVKRGVPLPDGLVWAEAEVQSRKALGRSQVRVEHVDGEPWFGHWLARSEGAHPTRGASYRVEVRSLDERINHCTCPDFAVNRLGTCKHVEAVLHRLRIAHAHELTTARRKQNERAVVYLSWLGPHAPRPAAYLGRDLCPEAKALLVPRLDARWRLRADAAGGHLSSTEAAASHLEALRELAALHEQITVSSEVLGWAAWQSQRAQASEAAKRAAQGLAAAGGRVVGWTGELGAEEQLAVAHLAGKRRALLEGDEPTQLRRLAIAAARWLTNLDQAPRWLVVAPEGRRAAWERAISEVGAQVRARDRLLEPLPPARGARAPLACVLSPWEAAMAAARWQPQERPELAIFDAAHRQPPWDSQAATNLKSLAAASVFVLSPPLRSLPAAARYTMLQLVDERAPAPIWLHQPADDPERAWVHAAPPRAVAGADVLFVPMDKQQRRRHAAAGATGARERALEIAVLGEALGSPRRRRASRLLLALAQELRDAEPQGPVVVAARTPALAAAVGEFLAAGGSKATVTGKTPGEAHEIGARRIFVDAPEPGAWVSPADLVIAAEGSEGALALQGVAAAWSAAAPGALGLEWAAALQAAASRLQAQASPGAESEPTTASARREVDEAWSASQALALAHSALRLGDVNIAVDAGMKALARAAGETNWQPDSYAQLVALRARPGGVAALVELAWLEGTVLHGRTRASAAEVQAWLGRLDGAVGALAAAKGHSE